MTVELNDFGKEIARRLYRPKKNSTPDYYEVDLIHLKNAVAKVRVKEAGSDSENLADQWFEIARMVNTVKEHHPSQQAEFGNLANHLAVLAANIMSQHNTDIIRIPKSLMHVVYMNTNLLGKCIDHYVSYQETVKPVVEGKIYHLVPGSELRAHYNEQRNKLSDEARAAMNFVYDPATIMTHFSSTITNYCALHPEIGSDYFKMLNEAENSLGQKLLPPPENYLLDIK